MSEARLAPTRLALVRANRRLQRLSRGAAVLRRNREALVTELFRIARPAADARDAIARVAREAYPYLLAALAKHGFSGLRAIARGGRGIGGGRGGVEDRGAAADPGYARGAGGRPGRNRPRGGTRGRRIRATH